MFHCQLLMLVLSLFVFVVISALKVESAKCRAHNSEPVLQEFFRLKKECVQKDEENRKEKEFSNKKNWMSSVQLWNTTITSDDHNSHKHKIKQLEIKVTINKKMCVYLFY